MIHGSSIFSTGGGLPFEIQKKLFHKLFLTNPKMPLISIDELQDNDFICKAYAVGSGGNANVDLSVALKKGMQVLQSYTHKKFKAISAGETNIDVLVFQAALHLGLPVMDADATGGRAVPEIQIDNFPLFGKSTLPLVAVTPHHDIIIVKETSDLSRVEAIIRNLLAPGEKGLITVLDHCAQVKDAKKILTHGIFERAIKLGKFIEENKNNKEVINLIVEKIEGKVIIGGTVKATHLKNNAGFLEGNYIIRDENKNSAKVFVKNENLLCLKNEKVVCGSPDFIITLDKKTLRGIHNSTISIGQDVLVIYKKAQGIWNTQKGRALFDPKQFGFGV